MAATKRKRGETARKLRKDDVVRMRVTADEKDAMERKAGEAGLSVSAWLRQLALRAAGVLRSPEGP